MDRNVIIAKQIEDEKSRREAEASKPPKMTAGQVREARFVWMAGTVAVDFLTAWIIWQSTQFAPYAIIWVLAGAGGLLYSERLKERIGNNKEQKSIGDRGVIASAVAVFGMALLVGTVWVMDFTFTWLNGIIEIVTLLLFFFHLFQSYKFHSVDDEIVAANEEARSEEDNARQIRGVHRAARLVDSMKSREGLADAYRQEHGPAIDSALAVYGVQVSKVEEPTSTHEAVKQNGGHTANPPMGQGKN